MRLITIYLILSAAFLVFAKESEVTVDREAVRRVFKSHLSEFKKCYEAEYSKNKTLTGKVVLFLEITDESVVKTANIKSTTLKNENVENCLIDKVKTLAFPAAPKGTVETVTYPFVFRPSELKENK
jgi:hypothetical protein